MASACIYFRMLTHLVAVLCFACLSSGAQNAKEYRYIVGAKPVVSITNNYGSITVQPSGNNQVVVTALKNSEAVSFFNEQRGDRVELLAESKQQGTGLADYMVLVPENSFICLRSTNGSLHVHGLRGDVILKAGLASVEVTEISDAHVHIQSLSGPVLLSDTRNSHVDIRSVSGNVNMRRVIRSSVDVNSASGRITYQGDPGAAGEYTFSSQTGDLDISIPSSALVEIKGHSLKGKFDEESANPTDAQATGQTKLFVKPGTVTISRFVLRSFKGKIRVNRP